MKRGNYKAMSVLLKAGLVAIFALMPFVFFGCSELVDEVAQTLAPKGTPPNDEGGRGDAGKTISAPLQDGTTLTFSTVAQNVAYVKDGSHTQAVTPTDVQGDTGEIRYESSNPEVATVNETSGKVSFKKPGFTIITATKAATAAYKAHSVSYALAIQDSSPQNSVKAPTFIIPTNLQWGTLVTFTRDSGYAYRIVPPTNLVKIQDSTQKGESEIVAVGAATVALLATRTTDGSVVVSKQVSFGLQKGTTLKFKKATESVKYEDGNYTQAVEKTEVTGDAGEISYKSSDESIATVDKKTGTVTFKKGGSVTITAQKEGTPNKYQAQDANYALAIEKLAVTDPKKPKIAGAQGSWKVARAISNYNAKYKYEVVKGAISIVNGKVEATEATSGTIRVQKEETDTEKASQWVVSDPISFDIDAGTTLKFNQTPVNVQYKDRSYTQKVQNQATVQGDAGEISYKSDKPDIATVNKTTGKVQLTFKKSGNVIITATKAGTPKKYDAHSATYTLIVLESAIKPQLMTIPANLQWGTPVRFVQEQKQQYDIKVIKNVGNFGVKIENGNEVHAKGAMRVKVKATSNSNDEAFSDEIYFGLQNGTTLEFTNTQEKVLYQKGGSHTQKVQKKTTVQGDIGQIRYKSSDPNIATVDGNGKVSFQTGGTVIITATKAATANKYQAHNAKYTLEIEKLSVQDPKAPIIEGTPGSWRVARTIKGYDLKTYEYKSNTGNIRIVNGKVEAVEKTSGTISIRKKETSTHKASQWVVSNKIIFNLDEGTTLKFNKTPVNVKYKDGSHTQKVQNQATVQGDTGQIRYESSDPKIAMVDGNGKVSFQTGGKVTITATKAGTQNKYKKQSASYELEIIITVSLALHGGIFNGNQENNITFIVQRGQSLKDIGIRTKLTYPSINGVTRTLVRFEHNNNKYNENTAITSDVSLSVVWKNSCGVNGIVETEHPKDRTALKELVDNAIKKTPRRNLNHIDTSAITDMNELFYLKGTRNEFKGEVGCWNTSKVTNMSRMFYDAEAFSQDISQWNTSKVEDMSYMFSWASNFNEDIGAWDTSQVKNMSFVFSGASDFNQNIGSWKTAQVENMSFMFSLAYKFNQDISGWDTSKVKTMAGMFHEAKGFNRNIGSWKTAQVENMSHMFYEAGSFNQDISGWDTSKVKNMGKMFYEAGSFSQDLRGWNVNEVREWIEIFYHSRMSNKNKWPGKFK